MEATAAIVGTCWAMFVGFWIVWAFRVKRTKAWQPLSERLIYLLFIGVAAVLLNGRVGTTLMTQRVLPQGIPIRILADVLVVLGLLIAIWARVTLAGNWSAQVTLKENHELIQRGPYRFVRHPIYSGLLLMILGTAVIAGQLGGFVALAICGIGLWVKLRQEEKLLTQHLPGYAEYKSRTRALIPYLF
jgi:protein-S-isoprenylcysteine O-methyltransferase Ste14